MIEDIESKFALKMDITCYCGKKIKILYDEVKEIKATRCKHCSYNHTDIIFTFRKEADKLAQQFTFKKW